MRFLGEQGSQNFDFKPTPKSKKLNPKKKKKVVKRCQTGPNVHNEWYALE
jgi:hypothetical protein